MDGGPWQAVVHGVAKSQRRLSAHTHTHTHARAKGWLVVGVRELLFNRYSFSLG